jgi:hypothetical protein
MTIEIRAGAPIYEVPDSALPPDWRTPENIALKTMGDRILTSNQFAGIKVRSAVMPEEYNVVLNPLFPDFTRLVKVIKVEDYEADERL